MYFSPSTPEFYAQEYANPQNPWANISNVPMQSPETPRQAARGDITWQENVLEHTSTQAPEEEIEQVSPTDMPRSNYAAVGEKKDIEPIPEENIASCDSVTPPLTSRSASMNFASLSLNISSARLVSVAKRLSLPTLQRSSKFWEEDLEEE